MQTVSIFWTQAAQLAPSLLSSLSGELLGWGVGGQNHSVSDNSRHHGIPCDPTG